MEKEFVIRESWLSRFLCPVVLLGSGAAILIRSPDLIFQLIGTVLLLGGVIHLVSGIFFSDRVVLDSEARLVRRISHKGARRFEDEYSLLEIKRLETRIRATEELPKALVLQLNSGEEVSFPEGAHRQSERIRLFIRRILDRPIPHREMVT